MVDDDCLALRKATGTRRCADCILAVVGHVIRTLTFAQRLTLVDVMAIRLDRVKAGCLAQHSTSPFCHLADGPRQPENAVRDNPHPAPTN